jgi:Glycosyl hydrolase family 76
MSSSAPASRGLELWEATLAALYHSRVKLFYEDTSQPPRFAYLWPFITAFGAALDLLSLGRERAMASDLLSSLESYWHPSLLQPSGYASAVQPPLGPGGDLYYDDNAWVGLELLRAAHLLQDSRRLIDRAGKLFDLAVSGWDKDSSHPAPGGVFWVRANWNRDRGVDCVAPNAMLGLALFELTGRASCLEWSRRMIDWARQYFRQPDGRYWDKIALDGTIDRRYWSYNQGTMAAAGARLARLTGQRQPYLDEARQTATAVLELGPLEDQPSAFNAILFKSLLSEPELPDPRRAARSYLDWVWSSGRREPSTGLFDLPPHGPAKLLDQAALVQIAALAA